MAESLQKSTISQDTQSTYSVSQHFKAAERNKKGGKRGQQQNQGNNAKAEINPSKSENQEPKAQSLESPEKEKVLIQNSNGGGVSTVNEAVNETDSEPAGSIPGDQEQSKRKELNSTTFSARAENTRAVSHAEAFTENEAAMTTVLTETIMSIGEKFEKMGSTFENKLQMIESRHQELEKKLMEVAKQTNASTE